MKQLKMLGLRYVLDTLVMCATATCIALLAGCAPSSLVITDLECEYLTDPLAIDVAMPRFSWRLEDTADTRGRTQTAYQVLVATEKSRLKRNRADVWDSGKTADDQSVLVPFGGEKLLSGRAYYWKVRVWDNDQKTSAWSAPARFGVGLLDAADWGGSWIQHPDAPEQSHIWYRKNLVLDTPVSTAFIYVASIGYHELYINGQKVDDRVLAPSLTRLDKRVLYVTYDITERLSVGENTIALWYGPGWSRYTYFADQTHQALRVEFRGQTIDGNSVEFASDSSWRCKISSSRNIGPIEYNNHGGEQVDARRRLPEWNTVGFDDSRWPKAKEVDSAVTLSPQMMEPSRIIKTIPAQKITGDNPYRVDMGKNFTGWVAITIKGQSAGDLIDIKIANRPEMVQDFGQINQYICAGNPEETFKNRFNYIAGRYITIEGLNKKPALADITGYAVSTDLERVGRFSSSNALLNQIYETDLWTFMANTTEGFTSDCPHRERLGYGEAAFATAWGIGLPNYRSGAFYTKLVRDWTDVQEENGWIHHTAPQINDHFGGPLWSSAGLNVSWEFYQTFGDKRILELTYDASRRWLEFLHTWVSDGLLKPYDDHWGRFLGEWAAPDHRRERQDPEAIFFNNCVYAMNLATFIEIAQILGKDQDAAYFWPRLEALKKRVHEEFFDAERNIYAAGQQAGRQVQLAFALLVGLMPENLRPAVKSNFEKEITRTRPYLDMGSSGLPILLKYLIEEAERGDILFTHLNRTTEPSYGYFFRRGETTWPEYWNVVNARSRIHTCYTGIASCFIKSLGGIRPDPQRPGYQHFLIKPSIVGDLTFVEASTQSAYGQIQSRWEQTGQTVCLEIKIPVNSHATVYLPARDIDRITESGRPLTKVEGVNVLGMHTDCAVLEVGSGRYRFSSLKPSK